ncbi:uncharacterized protein LODBEIA_P23080 [Lodderomyces beijingensis]|uniref:Uncharacterized protein n=1 Tax=Lodderomyces beijingensis TaxID=1775926 RepID=A0ABP0ZIW1_9ASCO
MSENGKLSVFLVSNRRSIPTPILGVLIVITVILIVKKYDLVNVVQHLSPYRQFITDNGNRVFNNFEFDPTERFNYEENMKWVAAVVLGLTFIASLLIAL